MLQDYLPEEMGTCSIALHLCLFFFLICPLCISFLWSISTLIYPLYQTAFRYGGFSKAITKPFQKYKQSVFTCFEVPGRYQKSQ